MIKTFDTYITEAKQVGTLYHFTNLTRLIKMLESGYIKGHSDFLDGNKSIFISSTRLYDFDWLDKSVRLSLDGNLISNTYKIVPTHYFNQIYNDEHRMHGQTLKSQHNVAVNQCEERIFANKLLIKPYVVDIQCVLQHEDLELDIMALLEQTKELTKGIGVPFSIVDSYKP